MPALYIIAGANGAGKSTAGPGLFPEELILKHAPFDGDKLKSLKQLEFRKIVKSYKEAGRLADEFVDNAFETQYKYALTHHQDFIYEGHFTEDSSWNLLKTFKQAGYQVNMVYMGLRSLQISMDRVFNRALNGGHNVPVFEIERNYYGNLDKLNQYFYLVDDLIVLDASFSPMLIEIASRKSGQLLLNLPLSEIPLWFTQYLPNLLPSNSR